MNNKIDNTQLSFWQLITKGSKIEIPIIQRDYAQGRTDDKTQKIRMRFLENLLDSIVNDNRLELDFVYGTTNDDVFQPLDGQQRLTTLFLLHWFIAKMENKMPEVKEYLLRFTYETRISSRDFCRELVKNENNIGLGKILSEQLQDASWFFLSWRKDPTIKAMLVMLDAIEVKIKQIKELYHDSLWDKLTSEVNPPITFYFKELSGFGLSDDLYIKMNARGKALTDFENFKAQFEKEVANNWETKEANVKESFSHKIDTTWTDLFWKHRNPKNQIDEVFIKFIAGIAINLYAQNQNIYKSPEQDLSVRKELEQAKSKSITDEAIKRVRIERRIAELFNNPNDVNPNDFIGEDSFKYLKKCFDVYARDNNDELLPQSLILWDFCKEDSSIFKVFIQESRTEYKQRVLFYAQTEYLTTNNNFNLEKFSEWMRVIRNIVQNSTIDSASTLVGALGLVNELSKGCSDIYSYLSNRTIKSIFAAEQIREEIFKSNFISNAKEVLFATEDTNFCKGKIAFVLYCIDYVKLTDNLDIAKLFQIQKVIVEHLSGEDISNDFRRGLMTIKDNKFYDYWNTSWLFAVNAPKRCLIENISELKNYAYKIHFRDYLKELLLSLTVVQLLDLIDNYIIPNGLPNWKKRIIKETGLLNFSNKHFIAIAGDDSCCWLIPQNKVANSNEGVAKLKKIE